MSKVDELLVGIEFDWEGTETGYTPILVKGNLDEILECKENTFDDLIMYLSDDKLFISAHILLTWVTGIEYEAFPLWNGLKVELSANGTVSINSAQRYDLGERWKKWYQTKRRPKLLPPVD